MVRYGSDGSAEHVAVLLDGQLIHLGDRDSGFVEVDLDELERVCEEDCYPDRVNLEDGEIVEVFRLMFPYHESLEDE